MSEQLKQKTPREITSKVLDRNKILLFTLNFYNCPVGGLVCIVSACRKNEINKLVQIGNGEMLVMFYGTEERINVSYSLDL